MENIQQVRRSRGRPRIEKDVLENYLQSLVKNIKEIPTVKSLTYFDKFNPPQSERDFIEMIENHTEYTHNVMSAYGFERKDYTIIDVKWEYDKKLTNMYLILLIFIFDEELREKALKQNIKIN